MLFDWLCLKTQARGATASKGRWRSFASGACWRCTALCLVVPALISCHGYEHEFIPPYREYAASFIASASATRIAQEFLNEVAERHGLSIVNKNREVPRGASPAHHGFSVFMFGNEDAVLEQKDFLWVSHSYISISLMFINYGNIPLAQLDGLIDEIRFGLEAELGIRFCRMELRKTVCEETKTPLLRYKARSHPDMKKIFREDAHFFPEALHVLSDVAKRWPHLTYNDFTGYVEKRTGRGDAFESMIFFAPEPGVQWKRILDLGNEDNGAIVEMNLYGGNGLSDDEVGRLASQVKEALGTRFGTPFCRANPETNLCDVTHARLEVERERQLAEATAIPG